MKMAIAARRTTAREVSRSTLADLLHQLGDIPPDRVRSVPPIGTATPADVQAAHSADKSLCELVDGTLVEKPVGYEESRLAVELAGFLREYNRAKHAGLLAGEGGMTRLDIDLVRIPDVSFIAKEDVPDRKALKQGMLPLAPTLAVEVLSPSNSKREMARKRAEYFRAGTKLVWEVDPKARVVDVYTAANKKRRLSEKDVLTGGKVLPGFQLPLRDLFSVLDE